MNYNVDKILQDFTDESGLIESLIMHANENSKLAYYGYGSAKFIEKKVILYGNDIFSKDIDVKLGFEVFERILINDKTSIPVYMHTYPKNISLTKKNELNNKNSEWIKKCMEKYRDDGINYALFLTTDGDKTFISIYSCFDSIFSFQTERYPYKGKALLKREELFMMLKKCEFFHSLSDKDILLLIEFLLSKGNLTNKELAAIIGKNELYVKNHFRFIFELIPNVSCRSALLAFLLERFSNI